MADKTYREKIETLADIFETRFPGLYHDCELIGIVTHPSFGFSSNEEQEIISVIHEVFFEDNEPVRPVRFIVESLRQLARSQ